MYVNLPTPFGEEPINLSYKLGLSGLGIGLSGAGIEVFLEQNGLGSFLFWLGWLIIMTGMFIGFTASGKKE